MSANKVGVYLKNRRKTLNLTQEDLSGRLASYGHKYAVSTIGWWETGRGLPPLNDPLFIEALAVSLEVSVNSLLQNLGIYISGAAIKEADLTPAERELLDSYRSGDFQNLMRIVANKPVPQKQ